MSPIFGPKKHGRKITASILTPFSELLPNLHYSPIKKLENIFIFKIARSGLKKKGGVMWLTSDNH
jgi:hypothetical protein